MSKKSVKGLQVIPPSCRSAQGLQAVLEKVGEGAPSGLALDQRALRFVRPEGLERPDELAGRFKWELNAIGADDRERPLSVRPRGIWKLYALHAPCGAIAATVLTLKRGRVSWTTWTRKGGRGAEGVEPRVRGDKDEAVRRAMSRCEAEVVDAGWWTP